METIQASSLDLVDTQYSACSVSACPSDRSIVACGLYQVQKDENAPQLDESSPVTKRLGRCLLIHLDENGKFSEMDRVEQSAILDMSWTNEANVQRLAIATSTGQIVLYDLQGKKLSERQAVQVCDPSILCLSLDWDNRRSRSAGKLVVSTSDGKVSVLSGETEMQVEQTWHAHDFEPWIAAWDYWNTDSVWTGGDDCKLKLWDLRQGTSRPSALNKTFEAGITTIQSNPHVEQMFAVGSYDENVRTFDRRNISTPLNTHHVGGGVWRVRWHPDKKDTLLTACMHDGFKILEYDPSWAFASTSLRFDEHGKDALAYGSDWGQSLLNGDDLIATCSFYDHQLRSWKTGPAV